MGSRHNVSLLRHHSFLTEYDPKPGVAVATLAYEYPSFFEVPEHAHGSDQIIYAISGLMEVFSDGGVWLIPPHFALWIPAGTHHRICMNGTVSMRTLYLRIGLAIRSDYGQLEFSQGQLKVPKARAAKAIQVGDDLYGER